MQFSLDKMTPLLMNFYHTRALDLANTGRVLLSRWSRNSKIITLKSNKRQKYKRNTATL